MESFKRNYDEVDPDYVFPEVKKIKTEDTRSDNEKVIEIIKREFQNEISYKERELEEIEDRLKVAMKTLQLLRSVCIQTYYNRSDLIINSFHDAETKLKDPNIDTIIDPQIRPHPAVRKIIGKAPLHFEQGRTRKKNSTSIDLKKQFKIEASDNERLEGITIKEEPKHEEVKEARVSESYENCKSTVDENTSSSRNERFKKKHRIIVGNISKWLEPSNNSQDMSTHKWMVYVRGPKDKADVSSIIKKVRFFLHPSYRPNDIVEIRSSPFHLSRRGWGEFPLRTQIHFANNLNKPVDVIHNLKLDRTHTGLQTLGSETLVDVWLYTDPLHVMKNILSETNINENLTNLENTEMDKTQDTYDIIKKTSFNGQNGVCSNNVVNHDLMEHTIVRHQSIQDACDAPQSSNDVTNSILSSSSPNNPTKNSLLPHISDPINTFLTPRELNRKISNTDLPLSQSETLDHPEMISKSEVSPKSVNDAALAEKIIHKNGKICLLKNKSRSLLKSKSQVSLLKSCITKQGISLLKRNYGVDEKRVMIIVRTIAEIHDYCKKPMEVQKTNVAVKYDRFLLYFKEQRFRSVSTAILYLLRHLPLVSSLAIEPLYVRMFPYVASSNEEFLSWNTMKRFNSEWFRAKYILNLLRKKNIPGNDKWSTKSILKFSRMSGFGFIANPDQSLVNKSVPVKTVNPPTTLFTYTENKELNEWLRNVPSKCERDILDDEEINVTDLTPGKKLVKVEVESIPLSNVIEITSNEVPEISQFNVKDITAEIGITLKPEEIIPDVWCASSEICLMVATKCLAEELIRRALMNRSSDIRFRDEIGLQEIRNILTTRPEWDLFLNSGLGKQK